MEPATSLWSHEGAAPAPRRMGRREFWSRATGNSQNENLSVQKKGAQVFKEKAMSTEREFQNARRDYERQVKEAKHSWFKELWEAFKGLFHR